MIPTDIREGDVIRLTPGSPACRVYRDYTRRRDAADRLVVDGLRVVELPADREVELVARHGNRRPVSLTKSWYLGPICVGSVVTYRRGPRGAVFRVADIEHGPTDRYHLVPYSGGNVVFTDARIGDLRLVRSRVVESLRRAARERRTTGRAALSEAGDAA